MKLFQMTSKECGDGWSGYVDRKFIRTVGRKEYRNPIWCWKETVRILKRWFVLPSEMEWCRITVYNRPGKFRHLVELYESTGTLSYPHIKIPEASRISFQDPSIDTSVFSLLEKGIKQVYVEVEYR